MRGNRRRRQKNGSGMLMRHIDVPYLARSTRTQQAFDQYRQLGETLDSLHRTYTSRRRNIGFGGGALGEKGHGVFPVDGTGEMYRPAQPSIVTVVARIRHPAAFAED